MDERIKVKVYLKNGQVLETISHVYHFDHWWDDKHKIGKFGLITIIGRPHISVLSRHVVGIECLEGIG